VLEQDLDGPADRDRDERADDARDLGADQWYFVSRKPSDPLPAVSSGTVRGGWLRRAQRAGRGDTAIEAPMVSQSECGVADR
jgi:hypothetical protein